MEFLKNNSMGIGVGIGVLFPIFGFCIVYGIFDTMVTSGLMDEAEMGLNSKRMRTITLMGVCSNIYWVRRYNQRYTDQTLRGVVIGTMLWALLWFVVYYSDLYTGE